MIEPSAGGRFDFVIPSPKSKEKRCCLSVSEEPTTAGPGLAPPTAKRPMNGFMLFAQKYRLQLIQQYPGRDNRYGWNTPAHLFFSFDG